MEKLSYYVQNKKWLVFVALLGVLLILSFFFLAKPSPVPPPPQSNEGLTYNSLTPGVSTKSDVLNTLGNPQEEAQSEGSTLLTFETDNTSRPIEIYIQNDSVQLIKEVIPFDDERRSDTIRKRYGNADLVMYGEGAVADFYLFVYLKQGIAYIGNTNSGNLLEIWYFSPTNETTFVNTWAKSYSRTLPEPHADTILEF